MGIGKAQAKVVVCLLAPHPLALREIRRALSTERFTALTRTIPLSSAIDTDSIPNADVYVVDIEGAIPQIASWLGELIRQRPSACFLALAQVFNEANTFPVLRLGVRGILEHAALERQLSQAIDTVLTGGYWVPRIILSDFVSSILRATPQPRLDRGSVELSRRETEVMNSLLENRSNKEIATALNISERTVKFHVSNVLRKFRVGRRADLILLGVQGVSGWENRA